jgi:hypothetical protein
MTVIADRTEPPLSRENDGDDITSEILSSTDEIASEIRTTAVDIDSEIRSKTKIASKGHVKTLNRPIGISIVVVSNKGPQPKCAGCGMHINRGEQRGHRIINEVRHWNQRKFFHCDRLCLNLTGK